MKIVKSQNHELLVTVAKDSMLKIWSIEKALKMDSKSLVRHQHLQCQYDLSVQYKYKWDMVDVMAQIQV